MYFLPLLLLLLPSVASLNVLMYVNVIGKSHLQFAEKVIALLNEHGHQVDVVMGMLNSLVSLKGTYGARRLVPVHFPDGNSPWNAGAGHLKNPFVEDPSRWNPFDMGFMTFINSNEQLCDLIMDSPEVDGLLSSNKYDVALLTGYDFCPFALAHHYKIRSVVSYVPTPSAHLQIFYGGLPQLPLYENSILYSTHDDRSEFFARVYSTLKTFKDRYMYHIASTVMNDKLRERFGPEFPDVRDIVKNTSLDFSNSHPLLEEPKPISFRSRYIGGLGLPKPKPLTKEIDEILNSSKKGTVLFSFGTQILPETIDENLKQIFINTFKKFPEYNFLWKFDGKTEINVSNVFNMKWLPQTDLLYDSRVVAFISHMGLNSFTETSAAGVPVVSIPIFGDQVHNAHRAAALGTGVIVMKTEITEENLSRALETVLFDERYRLRAKQVASMMSAIPDTPQRTFIEGIEFAAKFESLHTHYRLVGADHHFLVQTGWDVAAFLTISLLFAVYSALRVVIFVLRKLPVRVAWKRKID